MAETPFPCILSQREDVPSPGCHTQDVPSPVLTCAAKSLSSTAGMAPSSTSLPPH